MTNNAYIAFITFFIVALPFVLPLVILKLFKDDSGKGSSFYNLNRTAGSRQIPKIPEVLPTPPLPTYQEYIKERSFGREIPQNAQPDQTNSSSEASDDNITDNTYEINNDIYTIESDDPEISTAEVTNTEIPEIPPVPKKKKLDMTVSTILFLIGTAFVALSGIAFGVASWVRTSHEGKVAIIAAAAATAFVISYIFSKALKLSGSSISFYILGSGFAATAFVTAGYYKLMGEWLSFGGGGSLMLIAASFALAAFLTLLGNKFYDKLPLFYTSLSAATLSMFFAVLQVFDTLRESAPAFILLQAFITAAVCFGNFGKGTKYELPIRRIGIGASIFYGGFAVSYTINRIITPDFTSYFCIIAIIVQLLFYGIKNKKPSLISAEAVLSIVLSAMISNSITETAPDRYFVISFSILVMLVFAMHRFIPAMNNTFTELLTLFVTLVNSFACLTNTAPGKFVPELVICGIISVILASYVFHKNNGVQFTAGIISPIIPAMIAWNASYCIKSTYHIKDVAALNSICWGILTLILIGVTAALIYLPKHDFNKGFLADGILHANMIASGIILIAVPEYSAMIFIPLAMCLLHFAVSDKMKCNYTAVLSAVAFIKIWEAVASEHFGGNELLYDLVMLAVLLLYIIISRVIYSDGVFRSNDDRTVIDPLFAASWLIVFPMFGNTRTALFFSFMSLAIVCVGFIKKNTKYETASFLLTAATVLTAFAFLTRPFLIPENKAVSNKITIGIICLAGVICQIIWRKYKEEAKKFANIVYILSFISLVFDVMHYDTAANTIFVMSVMLLALVISIMTRSKTWFITSSASLFVITVFATRAFLTALNWWIYLFITGIILISLAAMNEYCKKNNETLKSTVAKKFGGWNW